MQAARGREPIHAAFIQGLGYKIYKELDVLHNSILCASLIIGQSCEMISLKEKNIVTPKGKKSLITLGI